VVGIGHRGWVMILQIQALGILKIQPVARFINGVILAGKDLSGMEIGDSTEVLQVPSQNLFFMQKYGIPNHKNRYA